MENIEILKLNKNNISEIEQVAKISYDWWGKKNNFSFEKMQKLVESRCSNKFCPQVLVAKRNNQVIGTISLVANDIELRQDLFPVITQVFVKEEYRNQKVASKLVNSLLSDILPQFNTIYLTTSLNNFYEKFGFEFVENSDVWFENEEIIKEKIYKIEAK